MAETLKIIDENVSMSSFETGNCWYCIRSAFGQEMRAAELLSKSSQIVLSSIGDVEVFCPTVRKMMRVGGVKRCVAGPLFPRYFFARFSFGTASRFVVSRPGVTGIVRFGSVPARVAEEVIEEMRETEFCTCSESLLFPDRFVRGQMLLILEGPFAGMEAEYVARLNEGQRALLLIEYLHQRVNVVADNSILEAVA